MSCQLNAVADFADIESVRKYLFQDTIASVSEPVDDWNSDSWGWGVDESTGEDGANVRAKDTLWLQECVVSISSMGELLVVAHNDRMVILTPKWDGSEQTGGRMRYYTSLQKLPCEVVGETITSVLCVPLASLRKSAQGNPDWTCIVLGFSSGYVRFYTETGSLLVAELLHDEPVRHVKCRSHPSPPHSVFGDQHEELYVLYETTVVTMDGFGLFQTLRGCRNQLARVQASCGEAISPLPLMYKKWAFQEQEKMVDAESVGVVSTTSFDYLQVASLVGGFAATYRSSAPAMSMFVATGIKPYVGYHYAVEGNAHPVLIDVASAVTTIMKTAFVQAAVGLFSFNRGKPKVEKNKNKTHVEPATPMGCRFGLCDLHRFGHCILLSPDRTLCIVTDGFGRVILVDTAKGVALRMWKGYRDAQCSWIQVQEDGSLSESRSSRSRRRALFLAIFAPKKGIVEVWAMHQGPRVAVFAVPKGGRLLSVNYGLLGLNNTTVKGGNQSQFPCLFLDPSGNLKEIKVPFHFALSNQNSKRARDLHILKGLKAVLKEPNLQEENLVEEVVKALKDMTTVGIQSQTLDMLAASKAITASALDAALCVIEEQFANKEEDEIDHESRTLLRTCHQYRKLVEFYSFVQQLNHKPPSYSTVMESEQPSVATMATVLRAPEREVTHILQLLKDIGALDPPGRDGPGQRVVRFQEDGVCRLSDFLSCFDATCASDKPLELRKDIPEEKLKRMGTILCQGWLYSGISIDEWAEACRDSTILPSHLLQVTVLFWLQRSTGPFLVRELLQFQEMVKAICSLTDVNQIYGEYGEESSWWAEVRSHLSEATNPVLALLAAVACRAVAVTLEKEFEKKVKANEKDNSNLPNDIKVQEKETLASNKSDVSMMSSGSEGRSVEDVKKDEIMSVANDSDGMESSVSDWESMSMESLKWNLAIRQLEDVALINGILRKKLVVQSPKIYCMESQWTPLSLTQLINKGRGCISELVAQWLSSTGLAPELLIDKSDLEHTQQQMAPSSKSKLAESGSKEDVGTARGIAEGEMETDENTECGSEACMYDEVSATILDIVSAVRKHFPSSLSSSVLLANLCWEYGAYWNRQVEDLDVLSAVLQCLKTIPAADIRRGVCCMLWSMFLSQRVEAAAALVEKVKGLPKERLCRRDVGVSHLQLADFLQLCVQFLEEFQEATDLCEMRQPLQLPPEEVWGELGGPAPLVELAQSQRPPHYELLDLHYQVTLCLLMVTRFGIKGMRPLADCFGTLDRNILFRDLASMSLPSHSPELTLRNSRSHFLCRIVTAAVQGMHESPAGCEQNESKMDGSISEDTTSLMNWQPSPLQLDTTAAAGWVGRCLELARSWEVNPSELRRHQICELYSSGYDSLAEEVVPAVSDSAVLASQLLVIAGQRLRHAVLDASNSCEQLAKLSPTLSTWLETLDGRSLRCYNPPLSSTLQLTVLILSHLPETHSDYKLGLLLMEAVQSLSEHDCQ